MRFPLYAVATLFGAIASVLAQDVQNITIDSTLSTSSIGASQTKRLTTWTYNPIWPDKTEKQRALAPIASSRQASLDQALEIALRAFPTLRDVEAYKITFAVSPEADMGHRGPLINILDDAWDALAESLETQPRTMLVSVAETAEDANKRAWHETLRFVGPLLVFAFGLALIGGVLIYCEGRKERQSRSYSAVQRADIELSQQAPPYTAVPSSDIELGRQATTEDEQGLLDKHQEGEGAFGKHQGE